MSIEEILDDFPDLTKADIQACFSFNPLPPEIQAEIGLLAALPEEQIQ